MEVDQLWAEAIAYYQKGESLFLTRELEKLACKSQRLAMENDPRQGIIDNYLEKSKKTKICLLELWCECLGKERADMKRRDAFELEGILKQIGGWTIYKGNTTGKMRLPQYGIQKTFVKESDSKGGCDNNNIR